MVLHLDGIGVNLLVGEVISLSALSCGSYYETLGILPVFYFDASRVVQHDFLCEAFGLSALVGIVFFAVCLAGSIFSILPVFTVRLFVF